MDQLGYVQNADGKGITSLDMVEPLTGIIHEITFRCHIYYMI